MTDQHATFCNTMAEGWNKASPDRQIELDATVLGYDDMHNQLKIALQSGVGAPDMCGPVPQRVAGRAAAGAAE